MTQQVKRTSDSENPILTISAKNGWMDQKDRFNRVIAGKELKNYIELYKNELSYNHGNSKYAKFGIIYVQRKYEKALVPKVYHSFSMSYGDPRFIENLSLGHKLDKELSKFITSGARQDGLLNINKKSFYAIKLFIPSEQEQIKISNIMDVINHIITLYERKTRLLSKLRTFLTQRLFSNSSKVSLYFDNKNWSKHKISEFLTERNEKVIPNPSIPLVSFTVEKGVTPKSKRYNREFLVKDDKKKYKITKKNDIVYNPANLKFGAIARNKFGNAAFSPIYVTFITKLNPVFTEFLVHRKDFIKLALKYQEGTVYERMAVKSKDFLSLKIYLPNSSRDINHIAQILQSLDTLVSLNKNKISLITLIKKELLNTMFI